MANWSIQDVSDLSGKIFLVTGANSGIGYKTCEVLLKHHAKVYLAARDSDKSKLAMETLKKEAGENIQFIPLDLSDLTSIRKAVDTYKSLETRLDVLINNAGVMAAPLEQLTKQGYDIQVGTNALGHFFLTKLLLPSLFNTSQPRVINITSDAHAFAPSSGLEWEKLKGEKKGSTFGVVNFVERYRWYGQSKLGNILLTKELVRRYNDKGLISLTCHPGVINTDLTRHHRTFFQHLISYVTHDVTYGATTQLYLATSKEAIQSNGDYFIPLCRVAAPSAAAQDANLAERFWNWCEEQVKEY